VHRTFPLLGALREYRTNDLRSDIVAGVTVGALALPSGMAFADIAGLLDALRAHLVASRDAMLAREPEDMPLRG